MMRPCLAAHHRADRRAGAVHGAGDVDGERLLDVFVRHAQQQLVPRDAGVVHQDVEPPEPLVQRRENASSTGFAVGDVAAHELALAAGLLDLARAPPGRPLRRARRRRRRARRRGRARRRARGRCRESRRSRPPLCCPSETCVPSSLCPKSARASQTTREYLSRQREFPSRRRVTIEPSRCPTRSRRRARRTARVWPGFTLPDAHRLVERDRHRRARGVRGLLDVDEAALARDARALQHGFDDAQVGLMRDQPVDVGRASGRWP